MPAISTAKAAFTRAITNDRRGVVSENDAKRIVTAALSEISKADDPEAVRGEVSRFVRASHDLVGRDRDVPGILNGFSGQATHAVHARLEALRGGPVLPQSIVNELNDMAKWGNLDGDWRDDAAPEITATRSHGADGYAFDWERGDASGTAYALNHEGSWVLSPKPVSSADLKAAEEIFKSYFDEYWVSDLVSDYDYEPQEVEDMRDSLSVSRVHFTDDDPIGLYDSYPLVFSISNPTGSDHGFYVGYDPATGDGDAGDFN
jgi:hypothetical protein